ncbi:MAG: aminoacyl-tRNA hydrolase [Candidatus Moraniibacteriota bacterium]
MKLIIGLGNPGEKYKSTRHNVGFIFLDRLQTIWKSPPFALNKKFEAEISQVNLGDEKIILAKPQTFMNLSGMAVQKILAFYKLTPSEMLVLHDDKDIVCGKYKLATNSSSAGHNGVQNIINVLGTKKFKRLRIGIKNKNEDTNASSQMETSDFVLSKLTDEDSKNIEAMEVDIFKEINNNL